MTLPSDPLLDPIMIRALRTARRNCHQAARAANGLADSLQNRPGYGTNCAATARRISAECTSAWHQINEVIQGADYDPENPHAG